MSSVTGRYVLRGECVDGNGLTSRFEAKLALCADGTVRGAVGDAPIVEGSHDRERARFSTLYNGCLIFAYDLNVKEQSGSMARKKSDALSPDEHGTLTFQVATSEEQAVDLPVVDSALGLVHVSSLAVPCYACDVDDGDSRLEFFDLAIPNFGRFELVVTSCASCGSKRNELRSTEPARAQGCTLTLTVSHPDMLDSVVVLSDEAVVRCDALELEIASGTGKYTTVQGLLRSCCAGLRSVAIASDDCGSSGLATFEARVERLMERCTDEPFSVQVEDALGLSLIQSPQVEICEWDRSAEQNAELGLVDASGPVGEDATGSIIPDEDPLEMARLLRACESLAAEHTREYLRTSEDAAPQIDSLGDYD